MELIETREGYMQAAMICSAVTNALLDLQRRAGSALFAKVKDGEYTTPEDFVGFEWDRTRRKKPQVDKAAVEAHQTRQLNMLTRALTGMGG